MAESVDIDLYDNIEEGFDQVGIYLEIAFKRTYIHTLISYFKGFSRTIWVVELKLYTIFLAQQSRSRHIHDIFKVNGWRAGSLFLIAYDSLLAYVAGY